MFLSSSESSSCNDGMAVLVHMDFALAITVQNIFVDNQYITIQFKTRVDMKERLVSGDFYPKQYPFSGQILLIIFL